jgi:hypothetical protein
MKLIILYFFFLADISGQLKGQSSSHDISKELATLFYRLEKNFDDDTRTRINDSIRTIIDNYTVSDSVFEHTFANIRFLGQIKSSDNMLKIITWNLVLSNNVNRYYCYFIRKGESGKENFIYRLSGVNSNEPIRSDTFYYENNWYGALYYDIRPVRVKQEKCYVLLGIDFGNQVINRKVIDVLSFRSDGKLIFGRKWFEAGSKVKYREVLDYDANGVISLKFDSDKSIIFDHLLPITSKTKEDQQSFGAGYSFDSYTYKNGIWKLQVNVDARNKE